MAEKKQRYTSEWLEKLRNMTPEEKEAYLEGKVKKGRRQAHLILGSPPKLNMTRRELREMIAREYPGLTLSDQIIEDRQIRP